MIVTNIQILIGIGGTHMIFLIFYKILNYYEISDMEIYVIFGILS